MSTTGIFDFCLSPYPIIAVVNTILVSLFFFRDLGKPEATTGQGNVGPGDSRFNEGIHGAPPAPISAELDSVNRGGTTVQEEAPPTKASSPHGINFGEKPNFTNIGVNPGLNNGI